MALRYRAAILGMISGRTGLLAPEVPDDAKAVVFNVAAKFPVKAMQPGGVYEGMPLDVHAFVKRIEDELGQRGLDLKSKRKTTTT